MCFPHFEPIHIWSTQPDWPLVQTNDVLLTEARMVQTEVVREEWWWAHHMWFQCYWTGMELHINQPMAVLLLVKTELKDRRYFQMSSELSYYAEEPFSNSRLWSRMALRHNVPQECCYPTGSIWIGAIFEALYVIFDMQWGWAVDVWERAIRIKNVWRDLFTVPCSPHLISFGWKLTSHTDGMNNLQGKPFNQSTMREFLTWLYTKINGC